GSWGIVESSCMAPGKTFTVGLVQMGMSPDPAANLYKALQKVSEAAQKGAQVVCLPEMYRSLYFCQKEEHVHFDLAETVPGPSTEALGKAAREHGVAVIAPLFERRAPG